MTATRDESDANAVRASASGPLNLLLSFTLVLLALYPAAQLLFWALHGSGIVNSAADFRSIVPEGPFLIWLRDSSLTALAVAVTGIGTASAIAYAASRSERRHAGTTTALSPAIQLVPMLIIVLLLLAGLFSLGLLRHFGAALAIYVLTAWPFCVWQLKRRYDHIPRSIEEAARLDGCSAGQVFRLVVLPLVGSALLLSGVFSFLVVWAYFGVAAFFQMDWRNVTTAAGLQMLFLAVGTVWPLYAAAWLMRSRLPSAARF